jgi:lysophospholipid acyltransferase (LPLAT)-like uncharacterized protein
MSRESGLRFSSAGFMGSLALGALFRTIRCERIGFDPIEARPPLAKPVVFVFWHEQLLPLLYYHRNRAIVSLVSDHRDGEYVARVLAQSGFETVRGSTTRGGVKGLKGLVRAARAGHDLAIAPDGPRGPAKDFKPAALAAARLTGLPVIPVAAHADRAWRLGSWDRLQIPKPFTSVQIAYGAPLDVPRDASEETVAELAGVLADQLNRLGDLIGARGGPG